MFGFVFLDKNLFDNSGQLTLTSFPSVTEFVATTSNLEPRGDCDSPMLASPAR